MFKRRVIILSKDILFLHDRIVVYNSNKYTLNTSFVQYLASFWICSTQKTEACDNLLGKRSATKIDYFFLQKVC